MFTKFFEMIHKAFAAFLVLNLLVPNSAFAARPTAARLSTLAEDGGVRGERFAQRAEVRAIEDVDAKALELAERLAIGGDSRQLIRPYLAYKQGITDPELDQIQKVLIAVYEKGRKQLAAEHQPVLDKAFALSVIILAGQPRRNNAGLRITEAAHRVSVLLDRYKIFDEIIDPAQRAYTLAAAWLVEAPLYGNRGNVQEKAYVHGPYNDEGQRDKAIANIRVVAGPEVADLVAVFRNPVLFEEGPQAQQVNPAFYKALGANPKEVHLIHIADLEAGLQDRFFYQPSTNNNAIKNNLEKYIRPLLQFLAKSALGTEAKRRIVSYIRYALAVPEGPSFQPGSRIRPYTAFSPDDDDDEDLFSAVVTSPAPLVSPAVVEWADQLAQNGHAISIDLPTLTDLESGLLDTMVEQTVVRSATTNNNGNLNFIREIQQIARLQGVPNPVLAQVESIRRQNPSIAKQDAVALAYEGLINDFVARLAVRFLPIYKSTGGRDGFVSTELPTSVVVAKEGDLEARVQAIVDAGIQRFQRTQDAIAAINDGAPTRNIFLKIPATDIGLEAGKRLESLGYNVNYTLVATAEQYLATVKAHKEGVRNFVQAYKEKYQGRVPSYEVIPQSVSSDFVSRDDRNVSKILEDANLVQLIGHIDSQLRLRPTDQRLLSLREKYQRIQALPADAQDKEKTQLFEDFKFLRGEGPKATTRAGLAFAQATILDLFQQEFVNDPIWVQFLKENYSDADANNFLSQQIYWASTGVKVDGKYTTDPFYLGGLVTPYTTNTVPGDVVKAIITSGKSPFIPAAISPENQVQAREVLAKLEEVGIDLKLIKNEIIFPEGLREFDGSDQKSYDIIGDAVNASILFDQARRGEGKVVASGVVFDVLGSTFSQNYNVANRAAVYVNGQLVALDPTQRPATGPNDYKLQVYAEVIKKIEEAPEHKKAEYLFYQANDGTLFIQSIRSEIRLAPSDILNLTQPKSPVLDAQGQVVSPEVERFVDLAASFVGDLVVPEVENQAAFRQGAYAPFSANHLEVPIFDAYFAFDLGGLALIPSLAGGERRAVVIVDNSKQEGFVTAFNQKLDKAQQILVAHNVEEAVELLKQKMGIEGGVAMRGFVSSLATNAERLKKDLEAHQVTVSIVTTTAFNQMVSQNARLSRFVETMRQQFVAFAKAA